MSNPIKELRKQLRPLVEEHLPEVLADKVAEAILKKVEARLDKIESDHKKLVSYLIRLESQATGVKASLK